MKKVFKLPTTLLLITFFVTPLLGNDNNQILLQQPEQMSLEKSESLSVASKFIEQKSKESFLQRFKRKLYEQRAVLAGAALTLFSLYGLYKWRTAGQIEKPDVKAKPDDGMQVVSKLAVKEKDKPAFVHSEQEEEYIMGLAPSGEKEVARQKSESSRLLEEQRPVPTGEKMKVKKEERTEALSRLSVVLEQENNKQRFFGELDVIKEEQGVPLRDLVNVRNEVGETLLHRVVSKANENFKAGNLEKKFIDQDVVQRLLDNGFDPLKKGAFSKVCSLDRSEFFWGEPSILKAAFGPYDGSVFVWGLFDFTMKLLDYKTKDVIAEFAHTDRIVSVELSPEGDRVLTGSWDGRVIVWDVQTGRQVSTLRHNDRLGKVCWSPDGQQIATRVLGEHWISVWDVLSGQRIFHLEGPELSSLVDFDWSFDGTKIVATILNRVIVWDTQTRRIIREFFPGNTIGKVSWSIDGTKVLMTGNNTLLVWDHYADAIVMSYDNDRYIHARWFFDDDHIFILDSSRRGRVLHVSTRKISSLLQSGDDSVLVSVELDRDTNRILLAHNRIEVFEDSSAFDLAFVAGNQEVLNRIILHTFKQKITEAEQRVQSEPVADD